MKANKQQLSRKIWLSFIIVGLLLPYIQVIFTGFKENVVAQTTEKVLLDKKDVGKVSATYELSGEQAIWTIHYEKKASDQGRKFLFNLKNNEENIALSSVSPAENFVEETRDNTPWFTEKAYVKSETSGEFSIRVNKGNDLSLMVNIKEQQATATSTTENSVKENSAEEEILLLTGTEVGPYALKVDESTAETSDSSAGSSEQNTAATEESTATSSEETSDSEANSGEENVADYGATSILPQVENVNSSLVITPVDNDLNDIKINSKENNVEIYTQEFNGWNTSDYDRPDALQNWIYKKYTKNSGKINFHFLTPGNPNKQEYEVGYYQENALKNQEIQVTYPKVGTFNGRQVGAVVKIDQITIPKSSKWWEDNSLGVMKDLNTYHSIDMSTNLYSGIYFSGISSMRLTLSFFYDDPASSISFSKGDSSYLTVGSVTTYYGNQGNFVKKLSGEKLGTVFSPTVVTGPTTVVPNQLPESTIPNYDNVYTSLSPISINTDRDDSNNIDGDYLTSDAFSKFSINFPVDEQQNEFLIGTGGSASNGNILYRAWMSFGSLGDFDLQQISFKKVDSKDTSISLPGAEFELLQEDKTSFNPPKTVTSTDNGEVLFTDIPGGTYYIRETKAPNGYEISEDDIKVSVDNNGEVAWPDDIDVTNPVIKNKKLSSIKFTKIGDNKSILLSGVEFELLNSDQTAFEPSKVATSGEDGKVEFNNLSDGNYYVKETGNLDGYRKLSNSMKVTIKDGVIIWEDYEESEPFIQNTLKPFDLTLTKVDSIDEKILSGAEFTLNKKDDPEFKEQKLITNSNGQLTFKNLSPGDYILTEIKAPDGYEKLSDPMSFTITKTGEVTPQDVFPRILTVGTDNNTITVKVTNKPKTRLPSTGGSGTTKNLLIGFLVVIFSSTVLLVAYLKNKEVV